jgi:hypothetical protein
MKKIILTILLIIPLIGSSQCIGDCENGVGTVLWDNGDVTWGTWKNGKENGLVQEILFMDGKLYGMYSGKKEMGVKVDYGMETIFDDDQVYMGLYEGSHNKNGDYDGWGTYTLHDEEGYIGTYVGEYKDGQEHGWGTFIYSDGVVEMGTWKNGKFIKED